MKKILIVCLIIIVAFSGWLLLRRMASGGSSHSPELVLVPAAGKSFMMGNEQSPNAMPRHEVSFSNDFYLGKYEITNQQYADVLNYAFSKGYLDKEALKSKGNKRGEARGISKMPQKYQDVTDEHSQLMFVNGKFKARPGKERFPVVEVTWYGAAFYCNMLSEMQGLSPLYNLDDWSVQVYGKSGYRLPTEAEWEYAATFDDGRKYPWGNNEPEKSYANMRRVIKDPVEVATCAVGSFSPKGDNKLGICDLAGNVAEWCNDWYNDAYFSVEKKKDPAGPAQSLYLYLPIFKKFSSVKVVRGGSFLIDPEYRKEYGVPFMIDAVMHEQVYNSGYRSYDILIFSRQVEGFRVARTVVTADTLPVVCPGQN